MQEFNGIKFYETKQGYLMSSKGVKMHRYVWQFYNGEIPKGYQIHHIDENKSNNTIENLALVNPKEHIREHMKLHPERVDKWKENIETNARPKACEWHKSEEAKKWHKEHWKNSLGVKMDRTIEKFCLSCGKQFFVNPTVANRTKYCCGTCRHRELVKKYRAEGKDQYGKSCKC